MCTAGPKNDDTCSNHKVAKKSSNNSSPVLFALVMCMAAVSIFSSIVQLEKIYVAFTASTNSDSSEPFLQTTTTITSSMTKLINIFPIPILSNLTFHESIGLCITTMLTLLFYIRHQLSVLTNVKLNMPTVKVSTQLPFFGTALEFLSNTPWDLMEKWHRQYGPIYNFQLLGKNMVSIEHPHHLKEILQSKIQNVKKDVDFAYKPFLSILGTGIVTSEGKHWMDQRRKISGLLKIDILNVIPTVTLSAVQRLMVKLDHCAEEKKRKDGNNGHDDDGDDNVTIDIAEELRHLTLQVISETFMSLEAEESDTTFATMYLPIVEEGNKRVWSPERSYMFFLPSFWKYIFGVRRLNHYVSNLILNRWELRMEERKQQSTSSMDADRNRNNDILDKVLDHFEKENPGKCLSSSDVRQLRDEFKTFMLAGHETSAAMMTWTFYELMKDDSLMDKVCLLLLFFFINIVSIPNNV